MSKDDFKVIENIVSMYNEMKDLESNYEKIKRKDNEIIESCNVSITLVTKNTKLNQSKGIINVTLNNETSAFIYPLIESQIQKRIAYIKHRLKDF